MTKLSRDRDLVPANGPPPPGLYFARRLALAGAALLALLPVAAPAAPPDPAAEAGGQAIDQSIRPGDDFYAFANGPWLGANILPAGQTSYGISQGLRDESAIRLRTLIQQAAAAPSGDPLVRGIGDYYSAWLDTGAIEAKGIAPLAEPLAAIAAISDRTSLSAALGRGLGLDDGTDTSTEGVFGLWVHQGFRDPDHYWPHLVQGGLGLRDPGDYLGAGTEQAAHRETYRAHVAAVLKLAGFADSDARAANVLALETMIARSHASRADTDDVFKTDNDWRRADFESKAPGMDWEAWFTAAGLDRQADFAVWQPSAVTGTSALVASQPIATWRDYLAFHLVDHDVDILPAAFGDERRSFLARLSGQPQPAPVREEQAVAATGAAFPDAIGLLYARLYFPPRAKAAATDMVANIRTALRARIAAAAWMEPATRDKAQAKLAALDVGLGYPVGGTDFSALAVARGDAFGNLVRAEAFAYRQALAKLARPVDPADWTLLQPQTVGALINFFPNALQFSASLLQPPYFDPDGDPASNYGSAGAGIGHEISHSFDELGNIYGEHGQLGNWWTAADLARYRTAGAALAAQFEAYCPRPSLCLKGQQVLSESIADLVGLETAHDAWRLSLHGHPDVVRNGLSGEQRFFIAFARRWRTLQTDAALARQVAADTHPPGQYRADTVRNIDAWYQAFDVKPGDKLYLAPEHRIRIW